MSVACTPNTIFFWPGRKYCAAQRRVRDWVVAFFRSRRIFAEPIPIRRLQIISGHRGRRKIVAARILSRLVVSLRCLTLAGRRPTCDATGFAGRDRCGHSRASARGAGAPLTVRRASHEPAPRPSLANICDLRDKRNIFVRPKNTVTPSEESAERESVSGSTCKPWEEVLRPSGAAVRVSNNLLLPCISTARQALTRSPHDDPSGATADCPSRVHAVPRTAATIAAAREVGRPLSVPDTREPVARNVRA
jgi:hypothetical protein